MLMKSSAFERAQRGAEKLDTLIPNWHQYIDVRTLDVADCERCVLGQLFTRMPALRGESLIPFVRGVAELGWACESFDNGVTVNDEYDAYCLTIVWRELVRERQAVNAS